MEKDQYNQAKEAIEELTRVDKLTKLAESMLQTIDENFANDANNYRKQLNELKND